MKTRKYRLIMAKLTKLITSLRSSKLRPLVFGMIHVPALPGSPTSENDVPKILAKVREETEVYAKAGVDGIILENMHDRPYVLEGKIGPQIISVMTRACTEAVRVLDTDRSKFYLGVQILAVANNQALAVAQAAELDFIRAEAFVFAHVADEGFMNACAGELLRFRKLIGAEDISIFADIKKKHSAHAITADVSIAETAQAAEFFCADGVILTGACTGRPACQQELAEVKSSCKSPILIGSGITTENIRDYAQADAFIIGSYFKKNGEWANELDPARINKFMSHIKNLKS